MRNKVYYKFLQAFAFFIFFCGLTHATKSNAQNEKISEKKGKFHGLFSRKKVTISGEVSKSWGYRIYGGVYWPLPKEPLRTPYPYEGKVFYVRKGNTNNIKKPIVLSFTVSYSGTFSFELPKGTYSIIQEEQVKPINLTDYSFPYGLQADTICLKGWWQEPYYILEVKDKDISKLSFRFHSECAFETDCPCLRRRDVGCEPLPKP